MTSSRDVDDLNDRMAARCDRLGDIKRRLNKIRSLPSLLAELVVFEPDDDAHAMALSALGLRLREALRDDDLGAIEEVLREIEGRWKARAELAAKYAAGIREQGLAKMRKRRRG